MNWSDELDTTREESLQVIQDISLFLGDAFKVEKAGIIRLGIKVPKMGCPQDLLARYDQMVAEGKSWDEIDQVLGKDPWGKSWLTPRNVDYFWIGAEDCFADPSHATLIRKLYADPDGKIRRLGIRFPFDDINKMAVVSLSSYKAGGLQFSGRYYHNRLMCEDMRAGTATKDTEPRRRKKKILKPCNPDTCPLYQSRECTDRGGFIFNIPGVPGLGVWAIYTTSVYNSMVYIRTALQEIQALAKPYCGLSGIPGGIFYVKRIRARVRADGKEQYLFTIDSKYDKDEVERILAAKYRGTRIVPVQAAIDELNGNSCGKEVIDMETGEVMPAPAPQAQPSVSEPKPVPTPAPKPNSTQPATAAAPAPKPASPAETPKVPQQLETFLRGIAKNKLFDGVRNNFREVMDSYCKRQFNKTMEELTPEEVRRFITETTAAIARRDVSSIIGTAAPASSPKGVAVAPGIYQ